MPIIQDIITKAKALFASPSTTSKAIKAVERLSGDALDSHVCKEDEGEYWKLLPGRDSGSTGEAKFECRECGREMFRGGWGSALWLDDSHPMYAPPKRSE
jgi:hypothetical protein